MTDLSSYSENTFEQIKHINEHGQEYWLARELQPVLEYAEWRNFSKVIEKAIKACKGSQISVSEHFVEVNKSSPMPRGGARIVEDYALSRYACYLIVQNGDPSKAVIAVGQTYFAVKTRQQELIDGYDSLSEGQKRLAIRTEMIEHNKSLAEAAQMAGVQTEYDFAIFQNSGYQGLYGGLGVQEIHARKGLKKTQKILDHMGSTELAANLFARRRPTKNCAGSIFKAKRKPTRPILPSGAKYGRPFRNWAEPCLKICPPRTRASKPSSGSRQSGWKKANKLGARKPEATCMCGFRFSFMCSTPAPPVTAYSS